MRRSGRKDAGWYLWTEIDPQAAPAPRPQVVQLVAQDAFPVAQAHKKKSAGRDQKPLLDLSFRSEPLSVLMHEEAVWRQRHAELGRGVVARG